MEGYSNQGHQARPFRAVHTGPSERVSEWKWVIAGLGVGLLILLVVGGAGLTAVFLTYTEAAQVIEPPEVVLSSPTNGSLVQLHQPVLVQVTVLNVKKVNRLEFWTDGLQGSQIQEAKRVSGQSQSSLTTLFRWIPDFPGRHRLAVKAYDSENQIIASAVVLVEVIENPPLPVPQPATFPNGRTTLVAKNALTVRAGPGETYEAIAVLAAGTRVVALGRLDNPQWWQILFDEPDGVVGWIPADPNLVATADVDPLTVQASVPLPTTAIIPTNTPTPADTPAPTPIPTNTPLPTDNPPAQVSAPAVNRSPGEGPPGRGGQGMPQGGAPNLAAAAEKLGITEEALREALGDPPPDLEAAANALGVSVEDLQNALGAPPDGGRP